MAPGNAPMNVASGVIFFERRVDAEIERRCRQRQRRGQDIRQNTEVEHADYDQNGAEPEGFRRLDDAGWNRARGGAAHLGVGFALGVLVERSRSGGGERRAYQCMREERPIERAV